MSLFNLFKKKPDTLYKEEVDIDAICDDKLTYDDYVKLQDQLHSEKIGNRNKYDALKRKYISDNMPFEVGDLVRIVKGLYSIPQLTDGIVVGFDERNGVIFPILCRVHDTGVVHGTMMETNETNKFELVKKRDDLYK